MAADFDVAPESVRSWMRQAGVDDGIKDGLTTAEQSEIVQRSSCVISQNRCQPKSGADPHIVDMAIGHRMVIKVHRPSTASTYDSLVFWDHRGEGSVVTTKSGVGPYVDRTRLEAVRSAALTQTVLSQGGRRTNSPHEFYRYPARFPPAFARATIEAFTKPGDVVLDPFVGGGTTLVEALLLSRVGVGADVNELATFISRVKTTVLNEADIAVLRRWSRRVAPDLVLRKKPPSLAEWRSGGYLKDLDGPDTWRLRTLIALALQESDELSTAVQRDFARCIILRTGQWALDMRSTVPTVGEFRSAFGRVSDTMLGAATRFIDDLGDDYRQPVVITQGLPGLAARSEASCLEPRLILTSPPYPGVYVNYHRWKLRGRLEIPAPFWIAGCSDGRGMSSYTMSARSSPTLYFDKLEAAFRDLRRLVNPLTHLVQMVGFNDVSDQMPRYLDRLNRAGFAEVQFSELSNASDGRLWRPVPGRRWWATSTALRDVAPHTAREVVLVHRPAG